MTIEELIKRLETTCFGLDPIDPLRLLVDDVIAALAQPQRTWVGLTDEEKSELWEISRAAWPRYITYASLAEAKLKERNT